MQEINLKDALETNVLKLGALTLEGCKDRLVIVEDEFKSGYECLMCEGTGSLLCDSCGGTGKSVIVKDGRCSQCEGRQRVLCPECKGKTVVAGGIVVPEASERRPTTGVIVSLGPDVKRFERGQSVIYPSFSGHVFELSAYDLQGQEIMIVIRIIQESDILAKVSGHLELRRVKKTAALGSAA